MAHKKLITLTDDQHQFIVDNERFYGVNGAKHISQAITFYQDHLRHVRKITEERKARKIAEDVERELNPNNK